MTPKIEGRQCCLCLTILEIFFSSIELKLLFPFP